MPLPKVLLGVGIVVVVGSLVVLLRQAKVAAGDVIAFKSDVAALHNDVDRFFSLAEPKDE